MKSDSKSMVLNQLISRGISNLPLIEAFENVPRHLFVNESDRQRAYGDHPLSIGFKQTISQPYIVAFMLEMLNLEKNDTVLEIGTGSGYQTAILSRLVKKVISLEIIPDLARQARERLKNMGYHNAEVHCADGNLGWTKDAPFQNIIGAAAAKKIPAALFDQLGVKGRMIFPVGGFLMNQYLILYLRRQNGKISKQKSLPVRFVPLV